MSSNKRDKLFPYLIFVPFFGPIISIIILHNFTLRKYPNITWIFLKFAIISTIIMNVLLLLSKSTFETLNNELLSQYSSLIEFIVIGVMINLYYLYIYKNDLYPMIQHGETMENEESLKQSESKVYKPHHIFYLFIPVIGVFIGYIANYNLSHNKSVIKLFISWLFLVISSAVFVVIVFYIPILSNSFNLNFGERLLFVLSCLITTIINDIIYLLHSTIKSNWLKLHNTNHVKSTI